MQNQKARFSNRGGGDHKIQTQKHKHKNVINKEIDKGISHKTFSANFGHELENSIIRRQSLHKKYPHMHKDKKYRADRYHKLKNLCLEYEHKINEQDQQIELLKEKIVTLHNFNEQFSLENAKLKSHIETIANNFEENQKPPDEKTEIACENCQLIQSELDTSNNLLGKYKYDNSQLQQDTHMLKILIYRLNVQLERYQEKVRYANSNQFDDYNSKPDLHIKEPVKWGSVNKHTLGPLLNALTQSISEKTELIQKCEDTLNTFTWKMKEILIENEHLHGKIDDVNILQNQVSIWKSRTEILLKKNEFMKDKLSQILTCYENKIHSMAVDYRAVCDEYNKIKQEVVKKDMIINMPDAALHKTCYDNLEESKKSLEELKGEHGKELSALKESYESELTKLKQEYSELKEKQQISKQYAEKSIKKIKTLQIKLEEALSWKRVYQSSQEAVKNSQQNIWKDMNKMEKLINMKEMELRKAKKKYSTDIKKMCWELKHKEECLQDVLDKFKKHLQQCTRQHNPQDVS